MGLNSTVMISWLLLATQNRLYFTFEALLSLSGGFYVLLYNFCSNVQESNLFRVAYETTEIPYLPPAISDRA